MQSILEWFCQKEAIAAKSLLEQIAWKGFDNFAEFLHIAQISYLAEVKASPPTSVRH